MVGTTNISVEDFAKLQKEKEVLAREVATLKQLAEEMETTNNHLVTATWREREMKQKLAETVDELNNTKQLVETQNKRIGESINYSKKIQTAINPDEADILAQFPESFMLYLPKDVISGDFPWTYSTDNYFYVASVDCTGHGVPGAMMSMIGSLLLRQIVNEKLDITPSEILKKLHEAVVRTLKQDQSSSNSNDGMDIGLVRIDKTKKTALFSGAHRPLFMMRNGVIEIVGGDKFPIGGMHYKGKNNYTDFEFTYDTGDSIFVFTDGLPDQIGGADKLKLMTKNVKTFLESKVNISMQKMKEELYTFLNEWKGESKQVDDILIIGIKF